MTKKNQTKRALISSAIALMLCFSMLVGTTFAWFTDSVSSARNTIVSGNLDVTLEYWNGEKYAEVTGGTKLFDDEALWEPGHTEVAYLKVSNNGTLALKYQLSVNFENEVPGKTKTGEVIKLSEHLVFSVVDKQISAKADEYTREQAVTAAGTTQSINDYESGTKTLNNKGDAHYVALIIYMPESVGNEANHDGTNIPSIQLGVNLVATQEDADFEKDSFGNDYDADAFLPTVSNASELASALEQGKSVKLGGDIDFGSEEINISSDKEFTVDLAGNTLSGGTINNNGKLTIIDSTNPAATLDTEDTGAAAVPGLVTGSIVNNGELTIIGGAFNSTITNKGVADITSATVITETTGDGATIVNEGTMTITDGTVQNTAINGASTIYNKGTLTLDGVSVIGAPMGETSYPAYAVNTEGKLTVEDGTIITSDRGGIRMNSGSEVVINGGSVAVSDAADGRNMTLHTIYAYGSGSKLTINGGHFEQNHTSTGGASVICPAGASIDIYGGIFEDAMDDSNWQSTGNFQNYMGYGAPVNVYGGTFDDTTVNKNLAKGYTTVANGDGTYTALLAPENGAALSTVAGYAGLYTDGTNYYVYNAQGLISMNNFWAKNPYSNQMWGKSYNIMADIDATGYTWNSVFVIVGDNNNDGFVIDGNGNTISGLTINGSMFTGTPNGGYAGTEPGKVVDLTFDKATVVGDHWTAVVWGNTYGEIVFNNVHVLNSKISGKCNTAAFVGGTVQESGDVTINFINCSVKNTTISANGAFSGVEGDWASDPNGANVYLSRAFNDANLTFENCVSENNTVTNTNGVVGGGIYGYTAFSKGWWTGIGTSNSFNDWSGLTIVAPSDDKVENGNALAGSIADAEGESVSIALGEGEYKMPSLAGSNDVTIVGTKDTVIDVTMGAYMDSSKVVFEGVTIKGSTGKANGNGSDYAALYTPNVTYINCTFDGPFRVGRDGARFINCTFTNLGNDYVWTNGNDVTFEGCTFNTDGKAILIYSDGGNEIAKVTVKNCTFNSTKGAKAGAIANQNCAAIEIHNYGNGVNLVTEGNKYDANFSGEWRIKTYETGKTQVFVNGTEYKTIALDGKLMTIDANKNVTVQ